MRGVGEGKMGVRVSREGEMALSLLSRWTGEWEMRAAAAAIDVTDRLASLSLMTAPTHTQVEVPSRATARPSPSWRASWLHWWRRKALARIPVGVGVGVSCDAASQGKQSRQYHGYIDVACDDCC